MKSAGKLIDSKKKSLKANLQANRNVDNFNIEKAQAGGAALFYRISKAIASVKDGRELLKFIVAETQSVFGFYDIGLSVLDKSGEFYVDWAVFFAEINPSEANLAQRAKKFFKFPVDEPLFKYAFARAEKEGKPFIDNMTAEFIEEFRDFPHLPLEIEYGFKQFLVTTLKFGGETFGLLNFNSLRENHFESCDLELFQAIADLVAVAIVNIRTNEEIAERAREKDVLLSVSQAIATIQSHEQLFKIIFERVQPIFGFHDVGLFVLSKDGKQITDWAAAEETISPSLGNRQIKDFGLQTLNVEGSPLQFVSNKLSEANSPLVFCYDQQYLDSMTDADFREQLKTIIEESGYKEFLATTLKTGGKTLGLLFLNSKQSNFFQPAQFAMFQTVADQIAVAVANIMANEEIIKREREKMTLLKISEQAAKVRDFKELFALMIEEIRPLLGFDDFVITFLSDDSQKYNAVVSQSAVEQNERAEHSIFVENMYRHLNVADDPWMTAEKIYERDSPSYHTVAAMIEKYPAYHWAKLMRETGLAATITMTLRHRGKVIGALFVHYKEEFQNSENLFPLVEAVANQLATTVANITANEEIAEREREKTKLLSISREIAKVQTRQQLLDVIFNTIKNIFPYDDAGLFYFCDRDGTPNPNGNCHIHLLDDLISEVNFELMAKGITGVITEGNNVVRFLAADHAHIISFEELNQIVPRHPHFPIMEEMGIKQLITIGVKVGGETIGMLCFNSCRDDFYSEKDFPLFENITNQVAVALTNILANEEILERTREKSVLLSISEDIASARNAVELMQIIREKAQRLIPFHDTGILIVEDDGEHHYDLAVNLPGWDNSEGCQKLQELGLCRMVHPDSYVEYVMNLIETEKSPTIENYERRFEEFDYPFFQTMTEIGYKEAIVTTLKSGGKTFGTLWLNSLEKNSFKPQQFEIFQTLADQVAVAVSNILANEEILEREREKSQLLAISEQLATIRDKHSLFDVIFNKLQPVFNFDDTAVALYDENLEYTQHLHSSTDEDLRSNANYRSIMSEKVPTAGNPHGEFINYKTAQIVTLEYFLEHFPHHVGVQVMKDFGLQECVIMPLRYGGRLLGTLEFHSREKGKFTDSQMPLFRNLADQVAVAVSNILANEEILERTREKSVLLSISEDIASARNAVELLQIICEKAQQLIPFHDTGILIVESDGKHHYDLAVNLSGWDDSEGNCKLREQHNLRRISHENSYVELVMKQLESADSPIVHDWEYALENFDHPFFPIAKAIGNKESIATTLKSGGRTFGTFWLNSLEKNSFSPAQFEVFQALADQVAVAVANILANEEIVEREREKSVLLAITEQIAIIRDKNDLFRVIAEKLKPMFDFDEASTVLFDQHSQYTQNIKGINSIIRDDDELHNQLLREKTSLENSPYQDILQTKAPLIIKIESVAKRYPDFIGVKIVQSYEFREFVAMPLRYAGKLLGVFEIYSLKDGKFQPSQIPIYTHLADQIAVAISNILANEEIERKLDEIKKLKTQLEVDNSYLVEEVKTTYNFEEIIGTAPKLRAIFEQIELVAPTNATVLLEGETGTGKELFARAIHNLSPRSKRPLIKVNCACLPTNLVESELFGHERGSFTGATERRIGKFELAHNSTIFLDEIGELPLELQAKLLRVLQEQELERIGGKSAFKLDIRVIAATNRNLREEVAARRFRSDLYFRLNTVTLDLPPLRERREDVPALAMHFVEKYASRTGKQVKSIATNALQELMSYDFPGNIRELEHLIEESVIFCKNEKLVLHRPLRFDKSAQTISDEELKTPFITTLADHEREHILTILRQTDGRVRGAGGAAEILNVKPTTLEARMKRLGIEKRHIFERL